MAKLSGCVSDVSESFLEAKVENVAESQVLEGWIFQGSQESNVCLLGAWCGVWLWMS
jgi:hypothetical protein